MSIAKVGDINVEYYVEGEGPPLLMIQGFALPASAWGEPFLTELRPHFQIIRFSNRGTGQTDRPQVEHSIRMMADDASGLLEALGTARAHVLGISMGGRIAQELVLAHPEQVQGLVLGCSTCGIRGAKPEPQAWALLAPTPGLSPEEQFRRVWPVMVTPEFIEREEDVLEELLRANMHSPTPVDTMTRQMMALLRFDSYDRLPQVKSPTLIIHGDEDRLSPIQNAHILDERIPNTKLHVLPGVGHLFFWEKPKESAEAIVQFLSSVTSPG